MREDWIQSSLEDLSDYEIGGDWGKDPELVDENFIDIYCIRGSEFRNWQRDKGSTASHRKVKINSFNSRKLLLNDILVEISGGGPDQPVGRTVIIDNEVLSHFKGKNLMFTNFLRLVRPNHLVNSIYINQYLKYFYSTGEIVKYQAGSNNLRNLKFRDFMKIKFPLPPLPEQRAIVKKLESLFSSLDAGVADLKKAQQQLKIYRQAVLKKAFEGDLTNATSKVEVVKLGSIIEKPKYGTSKKCNTEPIGKAVLRIPNINVGKINSEELKYAEFEDAEISALSLREGDILTIRSNGSVDIVGRCALISKKDTEFLYAGYLIRLRPNLEKANPKYLVHCLSSHNLRVQIEFKAKSTSGVNNINAGELESLEIPLFSLDEQNEIVKQIESRLSVCDSIEQNIKESLEKAEALRQSILKKAFEGNLLTAQELAECKQAADYEPASVLLERIIAEQNKVTAKPSRKKMAQPLVVAKVETPIVKVSADIHAGLIAKLIKIHEDNPASIDNLSHIKCEKIAHLVEYHLQIPLGRQPVKDAAGPDDYPHLKGVESRAKKAGFFNIVKKPIGYSYSSANNSDKVIEKFQSTLSVEKNRQLDDLIALFLNFDLEVSEIIATSYAGWNNLILNGNTNPSDEEIVYESRENWSERKLKIARERFFKAIEWMRKNEIVPTGYGAVVPFPKKKK